MVQDSYLSECMCEKLDKSVINVVKLIKSKRWRISVAESCTGGLLSQKITSVAGVSDVFELGICTYSNNMKNKYLGVQKDILDKYSAVSSEVALAMAEGLHKASDAEVCISVTGIAGPSGGTPEKPVGTVYVGIYFNGKSFVKKPNLHSLSGKSREDIRTLVAIYAFGIIEDMLTEEFQ